MTPQAILAEINRLYPELWKMADIVRAGREEKWPAWHDWCFLPSTHWYPIFMSMIPEDKKKTIRSKEDFIDFCMTMDTSSIPAFGAWRPTQDIVRFDETLLESIKDTELSGNIPSDIFQRLPAWCVYFEARIATQIENVMYEGFFALLDEDTNTNSMELRLLFKPQHGRNLLPVALHLGEWSVDEALEKENDRFKMNNGPDAKVYKVDKGLLTALNMVLYVCANGLPGRTGNTESGCQIIRPQAKKTKKGWRLFPPDRPSVHILGEEIGRAIREYQHSANSDQAAGNHASPRPHIRRAHWHGYWTGPRKGERLFKLQWLPPIPVALRDGDEQVVGF